jgi:hypothetical protein
MGTALMVLGYGIAIAGGIWVLVLAFQEGIGWGIGCLLCGIVQLVFIIMNFDQCWKPLLLQIGGAVLVVIGVAVSPPR